ncbi:MAG TPA: hypothetical protein VKG92_09540 [Flavobacteriales bacterium]|nr:hypothetical protein [Flavobacteriales bacterium]
MSNLKTLSILHYVYGGLVCLIGFICLGLIGGFVGFILDHSQEPQAMEAKGIVNVIAWVVFVILEIKGVLVILSGRWISRRVNRIGSMIIAGFCCLNIPLGLALGIFTFVTLSNDEVKHAYPSR